MANPPAIVNISPAAGQVIGVSEPQRFSLRDVGSGINRSTVRIVLGAGPVFYPGGELPEDMDAPTIYFEALSGNPNNEATVELDGDYLKVTKADAGNNQEAVFRMGGLEAPSDPDSPLMVEFTLLASIADMVLDGDFSGVQVGLYANDSGFVLNFGANGGNN